MPKSNNRRLPKGACPMIDTCTVIDISSDYAIIRYDSTGAEGQVALALLPENLNIGDRLRREFFDYEKI